MAHVIPTTKDAIITAITARPALNSITKLYAAPTEADDITWGAFWLGEEVRHDSDWSQVGAQRRRITFRIPFTLVAVTEGDDAKSTDQQVWTYFDEVEAALRTDPSFGAVIQQFDMVTATNRVVPTDTNRWEASITGHVVCTSRAY